MTSKTLVLASHTLFANIMTHYLFQALVFTYSIYKIQDVCNVQMTITFLHHLHQMPTLVVAVGPELVDCGPPVGKEPHSN